MQKSQSKNIFYFLIKIICDKLINNIGFSDAFLNKKEKFLKLIKWKVKNFLFFEKERYNSKL